MKGHTWLGVSGPTSLRSRLLTKSPIDQLLGAPIGASQVTAIVRRTETSGSAGDYSVAFRAALVAPYFVRLRDPAPVESPGPRALSQLSV